MSDRRNCLRKRSSSLQKSLISGIPNRTMASLSSPRPNAQPILFPAPAAEEKHNWVGKLLILLFVSQSVTFCHEKTNVSTRMNAASQNKSPPIQNLDVLLLCCSMRFQHVNINPLSQPESKTHLPTFQGTFLHDSSLHVIPNKNKIVCYIIYHENTITRSSTLAPLHFDMLNYFTPANQFPNILFLTEYSVSLIC